MEIYDFGLLLKELREKNHLTQKQLAQKLGVTEGAISSYERNISLPSIEALKTLAVMYRVKTDYLLGLDRGSYLLVNNLTKTQFDIVEATIKEFGAGNN